MYLNNTEFHRILHELRPEGKVSNFMQSRGEMKRREFLALCALGAMFDLLAACKDEPSKVSSATAQATSRPTPASADWSTLARSLQGTLIRPDSPQYGTARQLFDPRFDRVLPAAIAYCASSADVQNCIAFARRFGLPCVPRAGGHSYAGYSTTTGLVVDVTRISGITVDAGTGTAIIGAGARLIDVYATLAQHGLALPAGSCPTVGIAGLTLGGGAGVLGRKFGLTCDNLRAAQIVLADGRTLNCDATHNADLQVHPVTSLSLFTLRWPWSSAASVVDAWQHWAPQAPDELWSNCLLDASSNKQAEPVIQVNGVYVGSVAALSPLLQQLTGRIGAAPITNYVSGASLLETMLYEAGCSGKTVGACHLPSQNPQGQVQRVTESAKSDYFTSILPQAGINALVNAINTRHASPQGEGGIGLDAYGGAINRINANATAFVHRGALFSAQYSASWNVSDPGPAVTANHTWLNNTWQAMRQYASGAAYQNYVDVDLADWQHAYYGANLARLQHIKALYDPSNFFHFGQSIPPASGA